MNTVQEEQECTETSGLRTIICTGETHLLCKTGLISPGLTSGTETLTGTTTLLLLPWLLSSSSLRPPPRTLRLGQASSTPRISLRCSVLLWETSSLRSSPTFGLLWGKMTERRLERVCPVLRGTQGRPITPLTLALQHQRVCLALTPLLSRPRPPFLPGLSQPDRPMSG